MARPQTHLKQRVRCIKSWKIYFDALATSSKFFFKNDKETWTDKERKSSIKKLYMLIRSLGILCAYQPENLSLQHQTAQITIMSSHSKRPQCSFEDIGQCSCLLYQNMVAILRVYSFAQFIFIKLKRPEKTDTRGTDSANWSVGIDIPGQRSLGGRLSGGHACLLLYQLQSVCLQHSSVLPVSLEKVTQPLS